MKTCLMRYIAKSVHMNNFLGHSAEWESWCIYNIFKGLGYEVDMLNWKGAVNISQTYDVVFDVVHLEDLRKAFRPDTFKMMHLTGSDSHVRNKIARWRMEQANARKNGMLRSTRMMPDPDAVYRSIELADYVTLDGNLTTLHTYPERYWSKIHPVNITSTWIGD
jgi:hypothetical protein